MECKNKECEPWKKWRMELPSAAERASYPEYAALVDPKFIRDMSVEIRANAFKALAAALGEKGVANTAVVLKGGESADFALYCSDTDKTEFRQEAFFRHLFQLNEPDCYGVLDLARQESILFVPKVSEDSQRWQGAMRPLQHYVDTYGVHSAKNTEDLVAELKSRDVQNILVLKGVNTDSGSVTATTANFEGIKSFTVDETMLHPVLSELRAIKTDKEIEHLRRACRMSAQAHVYVMRHIKPGMTELQCEALFKAYAGYFGASRHMAYTCICGAGPNGAVLHYGHAGYPNDKLLEDGDMIVLDMGAEYSGYTTDLTRSYPVNGVFSEDQKAIHAAVYEAQQAVYALLKPGVSWPDMHRVAERVIITHLLKLGVLTNGTVDELVVAHMASVFMPHGLGHLLGLNVHDVGGYHHGESRSSEPGLCWLRCGRKLEKGMVLTVEPGVYFNEPWIRKSMRNPDQAKYIDEKVLERFFKFGGVRLEDDVVITEDGYENLSGPWPTTDAEIAAVMHEARSSSNK